MAPSCSLIGQSVYVLPCPLQVLTREEGFVNSAIVRTPDRSEVGDWLLFLTILVSVVFLEKHLFHEDFEGHWNKSVIQYSPVKLQLPTYWQLCLLLFLMILTCVSSFDFLKKLTFQQASFWFC